MASGLHHGTIQFSTKSLLCIIAIVCLVIAHLSIRAHDVGKLRRRVEHLGGVVFCDYEYDKDGILMLEPKHPLPGWLRRFVGPDYFICPVGIDLSDTSTNSSDIASLATCKCFEAIEVLDLSRTAIDDEALKTIASLSQLQRLDVVSTDITNHGIEQLPRLPILGALDLSETRISSDAVKSLMKCRKFSFLVLSNTELAEGDVEEIRTALPKCDVHTDYEFIFR